MRNVIIQIIVVIAVAIFAAVTVMACNASAEITLGILPRLSTETLYGMFRPLAEYLSNEVGEKVSVVIPEDFDAFKAAVKAGQIDLGFANSLIYVQLKKDMNLDPLALASEEKAGTKFRGIIIARKDSGINKVQELKGKKLVFVDKDSAAGYIFQMMMLSKAGLDIHKDFTVLPFAKKHDNVTMAVFNKEADAGGIREDDFEKMKNKVDLSQIKVIAYSEYFPNWPMFATAKIGKSTAAKIRAAFLKLKADNAESERVLKSAKLTGFTTVSDKDYDLLRQAAKLVGAL